MIGDKYNGPAFDRPCLRKMPSHWRLEDTKPRRSIAYWLWPRLLIVLGAVWFGLMIWKQL